MLERADFDRARRVELELMLAGQPGRVVGFEGQACGVVLARQPGPGVLGQLAAAIGATLGPVRLVRHGRRVLALVSEH